jgi:hypothetical protein
MEIILGQIFADLQNLNKKFDRLDTEQQSMKV